MPFEKTQFLLAGDEILWFWSRPDERGIKARVVCMQRIGYARQFTSEHHQRSRGGQALGALAFVEGFPRGTPGGVIEQAAQFGWAALGPPAATVALAGVAGPRVEAEVGNDGVTARERHAGEQLGEGRTR